MILGLAGVNGRLLWPAIVAAVCGAGGCGRHLRLWSPGAGWAVVIRLPGPSGAGESCGEKGETPIAIRSEGSRVEPGTELAGRYVLEKVLGSGGDLR